VEGQSFLRCFRDPIRGPRIENRVPKIRENHHWVPRIKENRAPRIREIGFLQVHVGYLAFSLKKTWKGIATLAPPGYAYVYKNRM